VYLKTISESSTDTLLTAKREFFKFVEHRTAGKRNKILKIINISEEIT
jgi:hypothetical protein